MHQRRRRLRPMLGRIVGGLRLPIARPRSAEDLIQMLLRECGAGGVTRWQRTISRTCATSSA